MASTLGLYRAWQGFACKYAADISGIRARLKLSMSMLRRCGTLVMAGLIASGAVAGAGHAQAQASSPEQAPPSRVLQAANAGDGSSVPAGVWKVLTDEMSEKAVRRAVAQADRDDRFIIAPGASWTLKDTLIVPRSVELIGTDDRQGSSPTFKKGFDGPLAKIHSFTTLRGIYFDGNKQKYDGPGVVIDKKAREVQTRRCTFDNNAGSGFVARVHFQSRHILNSYDNNDGYGIKLENHHHTNLIFDSCHIGNNKKGGVAYFATDKNTVWRNCIFIRNGGPGVLNEPPEGEYEGNSPGIRQVTFKDTVFISNAGPAYLARHIRKGSWGIVLEDCRVNDNASPALRNGEENVAGGAEPPSDLTRPIGGVVHLEDSTVDVELRGVELAGGNGTNNRTSYRATGDTSREIHLVVSGAIRPQAGSWGAMADIIGPNTILTTDNASLIQGKVKVKAGTGIDGKKGVVRY